MNLPLTSLAFLITAIVLHAQGLVLFNNRVAADGIDAPIFPGSRIDGNVQPDFRAALYGAIGIASESSLVLLTNPITGQGAVPLRSGSAAGYVNVGTEGARSIPARVTTSRLRFKSACGQAATPATKLQSLKERPVRDRIY